MIKKIFYSVLTSLLLIIFWPGIFGFSNYHLNFSFLFAFIPILLVEHQISSDKGKNKFFRTFFYGFISFGIFNAGTPIGKTRENGEVDLFVDPNQLSFVTVNIVNLSKESL